MDAETKSTAGETQACTRRGFIGAGAAGLVTLAMAPRLGAATEADPARQKIIGFTKPFQQLGPEQTADTVAEIGWDGIECPVRPQGQIEPERAADELPRLVEALRKRGKELMILTTAINRVSDPQAESLLRLAAKLGIRKYRLGFRQYASDRPIPDQLREISAELKDLAALNRELGLQAGFQNHSGPKQVGAPVWDLWTMLKDLDPREIGVCFDIGHARLEGGLSWPTQAHLVQDRFTAVFVKDFIWQHSTSGWESKWVMLGEGMVDKGFFKWLKGTGYTGPLCQHQEYDHGQGAGMIAKMQKDLSVLRDWLSA